MADDNKSSSEAAKTSIAHQAPSTQDEAAAREGRAGKFQPAMGATPTAKHAASSPLITNAVPAKDLDATDVVEANSPAEGLPQGTLQEMEAGRKALERNKPVAAAREEAHRTDARDKADQADVRRSRT